MQDLRSEIKKKRKKSDKKKNSWNKRNKTRQQTY